MMEARESVTLRRGQLPPAPVEPGRLLHRGKVKAVYEVPGHPHLRLIDFTDEATAFDGTKRAVIGGKGEANAAISAAFFRAVERAGVPTHFLRMESPVRMLVRAVEIIPLEVVVRNRVAGSLAKRLGLEEGTALRRPVLELFYKSDPLHDPWVNAHHAEALGWATAEELAELERLAFEANRAMRRLALRAGLELIDFKLEFGRPVGTAGTPSESGARPRLLLADEISPDTCRFWDVGSGERMDKDRFRRDLGRVEETYAEVRRRIEEAARWLDSPSSST
ncbi:MAG TPA: phosphoribosylaminoimidazolesuccinocarboxamide synthase [Limnochordales bacterium]